MMVISIMEKNMARVSIKWPIAPNMLVVGSIINSVALANINGQTAGNTRVTGRITLCMVVDISHTETEGRITEIIKTILKMAKELTHGVMGECMKEAGWMANSTVREDSFPKKELLEWVYGNLGKELNG
jgi:hypothetical protein